MIYHLLATLLLTTILMIIATLVGWWSKRFLSIWLIAYAAFFAFGTGRNVSSIEPANYKLPWPAGQRRLVAQGNRSILSHRDLHTFAWDFVMPEGTEVLAARDGRVAKVEDSLDGIGLLSNYILLEHEDGEQSGYAHIKKGTATVQPGDLVKQGQIIGLSGMVGQTIFPHLHFYVFKGQNPMPIQFVDAGIPVPGRFYTSENSPPDSN